MTTSLPGSVSCLFCNGAVNFMQGGKDKFYKHLTGEHDIHLSHNLIMAINFLDKETLQEIVTQFEASYSSEAGNLPGSVSCLLCNGAVSFKEGGKEKFYKHLKGEHDIFLNESLVMAINFLDQETLQEIVKQFEMSYNMIMSNEEVGKGGESVVEEEENSIAKDDLVVEAVEIDNTVVVDDSKNTIDVDDSNDDNCITLDDEPMVLEHKKPPAKKYKTFECSVCKAPFDYAWMLSTHMKSHDEKKKNFACDQCNKMFDSSSNLQKHTAFAHRKSVQSKTAPGPPKRFNPNKSLTVTTNKVNPTKRMSMDIGSKLGGLSNTNISKIKVDRVTNTNINKVKLGVGTSSTNIGNLKIPESISVMGPGPKGKKVATSINAARDVAAKSVAERQARSLAALTRVGVSVSKASPKKAVGLSSGISITKVKPASPPKPSKVINLDTNGLASLRILGSIKDDQPQTPTQTIGRPPVKRNNPVQRGPYQRNSPAAQTNTPGQKTPYQRNATAAKGTTPGQRSKSNLKIPSQKDSVQAAIPLENGPLMQNKTVQGRIPVTTKTIKTIIPKKPALKSCEVCKKQFSSNDLLSKHILSCVSGEIRGVAKSSKTIARKTKADVNMQSLFQNGQTRPKESLNIVKDSLTNPINDKAEDTSEISSNVKVEDPLAISSENKEDANNKEVLDNLNDIISMLEDDPNVTKKLDDPKLPENKKIDNAADLDMEVTDNIELEAAIKYL